MLNIDKLLSSASLYLFKFSGKCVQFLDEVFIF